jgi:hypothetical protein
MIVELSCLKIKRSAILLHTFLSLVSTVFVVTQAYIFFTRESPDRAQEDVGGGAAGVELLRQGKVQDLVWAFRSSVPKSIQQHIVATTDCIYQQ